MRDRAPHYVNTWSGRSPSLGMLVEPAKRLVGEGFRAIKIYPMQFPTLAEAEDCVRRVRQTVGREIEIMIDLNAPDDPHLAERAARRFEAYDPFGFEEPFTSDNLDTLRDIRSRVAMRVVSGERHAGKFKFREMLEHRVADVLNPDIAGCGGILESVEIAAMTESFSVSVSPHNYKSTTVDMAALARCLCIALRTAPMRATRSAPLK